MTGTKIDLNPQAEQMADESMLRTLRAQAAAIWPQERELIKRYGLAAECRILVNRPLLSLRVDFVTVDTLRVPRQTLADLMVAWRDGYSAPFARHGDMDYADVVAHFDAVIDAIHDPNEYVLWQVPVWSATLKS